MELKNKRVLVVGVGEEWDLGCAVSACARGAGDGE